MDNQPKTIQAGQTLTATTHTMKVKIDITDGDLQWFGRNENWPSETVVRAVKASTRAHGHQICKDDLVLAGEGPLIWEIEMTAPGTDAWDFADASHA